MKVNVLAVLPLAAAVLAGCSTPSAGGSNSPGSTGGDGGSSSTASHQPCPVSSLQPSTDPTKPWKVIDAGSQLPRGFGFVTDLGPSCLLSYAADGIARYGAYFFGASEDEVDRAYADAKALATDRGWTAVQDDADALGDGFIYGDWVEDPDDALSQDLGLQALMPLGPDFAPVYGVPDDTNLLSIEIVVTK